MGCMTKQLGWQMMSLGLLILLACLVGKGSSQCTENPVVSPLVATIIGVRQDASATPTLFSPPLSIPVTSDVQRDAITVMVGAMLNLTIPARWGGVYTVQNLTLFAYEEPGLPNGATLGPVACSVWCNPISRQLYWTPAKGQEGKVHTMCFTARTVNPTLEACASSFRCIDITVMAPSVTYDSVTPVDGLEIHSPVGCNLELCIQARDATGIYNVDINPVPGSMPPNAQFDIQCYSAPQTGLPVPHPLILGSTKLQKTVECKRCMHWEAPRGLETQLFTPCFIAMDTHSLMETKTCVKVTVPKCKYCIHDGDTLHFINKKYRLNSNWLQLWNANGLGELEPNPLSPARPFYDPDAISNGHSIINLGPSYSVQAGESLQGLASSFRTTIRKILDVNPDITDPAGVQEGTILCVMPCTDNSVLYIPDP